MSGKREEVPFFDRDVIQWLCWVGVVMSALGMVTIGLWERVRFLLVWK